MLMKRLLITGASGRIGTVLKEQLEEDYELFLLDKEESDWDNITVLDLSSRAKVLDYFEQLNNLDCVIHLGAGPKVNASWNSVSKNNIITTYNVFEAVRKNKIGKIIFASTNHVTGMYEKKHGSRKWFTKELIVKKSR